MTGTSAGPSASERGRGADLSPSIVSGSTRPSTPSWRKQHCEVILETRLSVAGHTFPIRGLSPVRGFDGLNKGLTPARTCSARRGTVLVSTVETRRTIGDQGQG